MDNPGSRGGNYGGIVTRAACGKKCENEGAAGFSYYTNGKGYGECRCGKAGKTFADIMSGYAVKGKAPCKADDQTTFDWCTCETGKPLPMAR
mmetsp:Transcript_61791/g.107503  ORF Transcript_61791/g.107503 Transcript_61791/m.107503 type:complete len:92 (-) Transcript_61791:182-457(-)